VLDLETIITALDDGDIVGSVSWFSNGEWQVKLGDPNNGIIAETTVATAKEVTEWLRTTALKLYPDSEFGQRYRRGAT